MLCGSYREDLPDYTLRLRRPTDQASPHLLETLARHTRGHRCYSSSTAAGSDAPIARASHLLGISVPSSHLENEAATSTPVTVRQNNSR